MNEEKKELRRRWKAVRDGIAEKEEKSQKIREKILRHSAVLDAKRVFLYLSMGSEVETLQLAKELKKQGKQIAVPRCDRETRTMEAVEVADLTELKAGAYGILEPNQDAKVFSKEEIDVVLVPGLAFDSAGYRLGYGGGYYDKYLAGFSGAVLGLAFRDCIAEKLPRDEFDRPVEEVITED